MKPILAALALLVSTAHGDLVITEVMAASTHPTNPAPTPDADDDWWELTNTGTTPVNLTGYKWDDTPTPITPSVSIFPAGTVIEPGEKIIILDETTANVPTWRAAWSVSVATQVIDRTQLANMGGEQFSRFSESGDEINLYNALGETVAHVAFGASIPGKSQEFHPDGIPVYGLHAVAGKQGAVTSNLSPSDTASPGDVKIHFTTTPVRYAKSTYSYTVKATKPGSSDPVISASGLPPFLTLTAGSAGTATLASNRALTLSDTGEYLVELTATSGITNTVQEYLLTVLNPLPTVILNEYNAVASSNFLNGGDLVTDDDGGVASSDAHFGRVLWNGGQWVEFVVLADGGTGTLDMRGWSVEIGTNTGSGFITRNKLVLSNNASWQTVPARTILTFIDRTTAQGGRDSGFAIRNNSATTGDIWTNIWMGDAIYLTYTSLGVNGYTTGSGVVSGIVIDNNNTQFRVKNSSGQVVFGPVGEGVAPLSGVSAKEVFELENHPTASVSPLVGSTATTFGYSDGGSESTFGRPNNWTDGTTPVTQRFTALTAPEIAVEQPVNTSLAEGGSQSFGNVATGANASLTFTIRNSGTADLTGLVITKNGTNAADFTVTADPVAPVAMAGITTFTVKFAPTSAGTKTAAIHITNNDDDESPFNLTLTGTAFLNAPEIAVQQPAGSNLTDGNSKKSFGTVVIGKTSAVKTFTIKNTGLANLTGLAITKSGRQSKDFIVTAPAKTTLAAGASTTFKVSFKPTAKGTRNATIRLKSNDADENPFDISLTGAAVKK